MGGDHGESTMHAVAGVVVGEVLGIAEQFRTTFINLLAYVSHSLFLPLCHLGNA
jgi:hypothetical protein